MRFCRRSRQNATNFGSTPRRFARRAYLAGWFAAFGMRLSGVVNQDRHDREVGRRGPSKYPPAFGIELHVDDSQGVAEEGRRHGFEVIVVAPGDIRWTTWVLEAVDARVVTDA